MYMLYCVLSTPINILLLDGSLQFCPVILRSKTQLIWYQITILLLIVFYYILQFKVSTTTIDEKRKDFKRHGTLDIKPSRT